MFTKAIKNTGYAILAAASLTIGGASLSTSAQAAPLNLNPIPLTQTAQDAEIIDIRGRHFRGHRGGFRGGFRGHRGGFRGHHGFRNRGFRGGRSGFRSSRFSRRGGFRRGGFRR